MFCDDRVECHPSHLSSGPTQFEAEGTKGGFGWRGWGGDVHKSSMEHLGDFRFYFKRSPSQERFQPNHLAQDNASQK